MNCCCPEPVYIGCTNSCSPSILLKAVQTGTHTIQFSFLGQDFYFTKDFSIGDEFDFPNVFNEFSQPIFQIINPDGSDYTLTGEQLVTLGIIPSSRFTAPYECFTMDVKPMRLLSGDIPASETPACVMKLTPVGPERFVISGDTVTVTAFAISQAVSLDVFVDGRLVTPDETGTIDLLSYSISGQDIIFTEDITGSEVLVKGIIETEYVC